MAKGKETSTDQNETITAAGDQQRNQMQLQIDDSQTPNLYSTTVRVWGTSEEINLDFAGPIRPTGQQNVARLKIDQRVVLNPWAAKRLAIALGQAVDRYERAYGVLELDERKRRVGGGQQESQQKPAAETAKAGSDAGSDSKKS